MYFLLLEQRKRSCGVRTWTQLRCGLDGKSQSGKVKVDSKLESHLGVRVGPAGTSNSGAGAV